jgi:hypothetical protein
MARTKRLEPVVGARVRLIRDIRTRGGRVFRAGLVMRVLGATGCFYLGVRVRAIWYHVELRKNESKHLFEVISIPGDE